MKFSKWHFWTRTVLFVVLGVVLARAGVDATTWRGVAVFVVLLLIALADWLHELCAVRRAYNEGREDMALHVVRQPWFKGRV